MTVVKLKIKTWFFWGFTASRCKNNKTNSVVDAKKVFTCCLTPVKFDPASDAY